MGTKMFHKFSLCTQLYLFLDQEALLTVTHNLVILWVDHWNKMRLPLKTTGKSQLDQLHDRQVSLCLYNISVLWAALLTCNLLGIIQGGSYCLWSPTWHQALGTICFYNICPSCAIKQWTLSSSGTQEVGFLCCSPRHLEQHFLWIFFQSPVKLPSLRALKHGFSLKLRVRVSLRGWWGF